LGVPLLSSWVRSGLKPASGLALLPPHTPFYSPRSLFLLPLHTPTFSCLPPLLPPCLVPPGAAELLQRAQQLDLPKNPLDDLIDRLGGPGAVAEMTGRKARLLRQEIGTYAYVKRAEEAETSADKVGVKGGGRGERGQCLAML
jgi:hypothetical protein